MNKLIISAALLAVSIIASADEHDSVSYGIVHSVDEEHSWVVIDDQAMFYGSGLEIRDKSGTLVADVTRFKPGTPVKYERVYRNQAMHLLKIQVIDKIPEIKDEEGVPER